MVSLSPQLGYENPVPQMLFESSVSSLGKLALGPHEASGEHRFFRRKEQYRRYRYFLSEEILGNDIHRVTAVTSEHHAPEESGDSTEKEHFQEVFRSLVHLLKLQK